MHACNACKNCYMHAKIAFERSLLMDRNFYPINVYYTVRNDIKKFVLMHLEEHLHAWLHLHGPV